MSPASHLVQILLHTRTGTGQPVTQARFEELLQELTDKFGGATSFVRAPGLGLWDSGRDVERDNIGVIEVMTDEIDPPSWQAFRRKLERESRPTGHRDPRPAGQSFIGTPGSGTKHPAEHWGAMPRKLKVYQTSLGFFDLAIAAPSMKAALEAWGAGSNLFHQGVAKESDDRKVIDAAMEKPGTILQ
jgi:hypothetical protein